jgi:hypothetical protein
MEKKMKLSTQALSCIMMALQKSLMEQSDIVPVLQGFNLVQVEVDGETQLAVTNPPSQIQVPQAQFVSE